VLFHFCGRNFGDQFIEDGLAKSVETLRHHHEGVWAADDIVAVIGSNRKRIRPDVASCPPPSDIADVGNASLPPSAQASTNSAKTANAPDLFLSTSRHAIASKTGSDTRRRELSASNDHARAFYQNDCLQPTCRLV
jgi:hypothetical protein